MTSPQVTPKRTGLVRLIKALGYSWQGYCYAWREEAAFREELVLAVVLLPAAFWLGQTAVERALLLLTVFGVLITELLNTGVEAAVNRSGEDYHPWSGVAKDVASGAVLLALLAAATVWGLLAYANLPALLA